MRFKRAAETLVEVFGKGLCWTAFSYVKIKFDKFQEDLHREQMLRKYRDRQRQSGSGTTLSKVVTKDLTGYTIVEGRINAVPTLRVIYQGDQALLSCFAKTKKRI